MHGPLVEAFGVVRLLEDVEPSNPSVEFTDEGWKKLGAAALRTFSEFLPAILAAFKRMPSLGTEHRPLLTTPLSFVHSPFYASKALRLRF